MRPRRPHRRTLEALVTVGLATVASHALAQEPPPPPPPMEIPTGPVTVPTSLAPTTPPPPPPPAAKPSPEPSEAPSDEKQPPADKDKDKKDEQTAPTVNNEGVFRLSGSRGTSSKTKGTTTKKGGAKRPAEKGLVAQWPGFHLTSDGGSEVMVEFSKSLPPPTEQRAKGSITYVFKGAHVTKRNNENPLITVHFNTPIAVARLVPKGNDLHLVIELRPGVDASPTTGIRPGVEGQGAQFFARFAPGHYVDEAAEGDEVPAGKRKTLKGEGKKGEKGEPGAETPPPTITPPTGAKTGPQP